jgi:hypothetical protein
MTTTPLSSSRAPLFYCHPRERQRLGDPVYNAPPVTRRSLSFYLLIPVSLFNNITSPWASTKGKQKYFQNPVIVALMAICGGLDNSGIMSLSEGMHGSAGGEYMPEIRAQLAVTLHRRLKEEAARKGVHLKELVATILESHIKNEGGSK